MRIAVIADTHGRLPESISLALRGADEIWHLGDFCDLATLGAVRRIGPPVEAVLGNNDFGLDLPMSLKLVREGKTFFLVHIPPAGGRVAAEFLLHGHTHVPRDEMLGQTRFFNPGTIGKPNKGAPPSFAWLTIPPKGLITWEIVRLSSTGAA
jgi:putative phosphoesterase